MKWEQTLFDNNLLDMKFAKYHEENPQVYRLFKQYAFEIKASGRAHYGAKSIFERMRWHFDIQTRGDSFRLNNNFVSRYVRMLESDYPEFRGFFRKRALK